MKILAIETSCDETAVAIVEDGTRVLCNVIASQIDVHALTGGVVPEVAAREHVKVMLPVIQAAFEKTGLDWSDIDAIAVTKEPGLTGSLVVGRMAAATFAFAKDKPLIEVNHIHGHLYSNWLDSEADIAFPVLSLTVSGGHNELVLMRGHGDFEILGESMDDAAGEAFDKTARLLGLGYPGGPAIEKAALNGNSESVDFPRAKMQGYDFSFSGLKTAVLYYMQAHPDAKVEDVAASFQSAVVDALVSKLIKGVKAFDVKEVHLAGGVSANKALRAKIETRLKGRATFRFPKKMSYCTDNAAMIGAVAFFTSNPPSPLSSH